MKRSQILFTATGLVLSVLILGWLFTHIKIGDVLDLIRQADKFGVAAFLVLSLGGAGFRCWRYAVLLRVAGYNVSKFTLYLVVLVRNLFSDLLPARIGTLMYVWVLTTRLGVPAGVATSGWAYSFIFDIVVLAPLLIVALAVAGGVVQLPAVTLGIASVALLVISGAIAFALPWLFGLAAKIARQLPLVSRLSPWFDETSRAVADAQDAGTFGKLMVLSVGVRLCKYAALYMFLYALLAPLGYAFADLNPFKVFLGLCAAEMAASLPISGIGGFGVYQGAWVLVFELLGFPSNLVRLTSLGHHLFTQAYGYGLGIAALIVLLLPFIRQAHKEESVQRESGLWFYTRAAAMFLLIGGLSTAIATASPKQDETRVATPVANSRLSSQAQEALTRLGGDLVFDSNASGTFGIHIARQDGTVSPLVDGPEHEMYPAPSADGKRLLYARTRSLARYAPAQVVLRNLETGEARQLADEATFPTWGQTSGKVYAQRGRSSVIRIDPASGEEETVFPREGSKFGNFQTVMPQVSPDESFVCFTSDKDGRWHAWCVELATQRAFKVGRGCEPTWLNNETIVYVSTVDAQDRSGIFSFSRSEARRTVVEDDAPPRGHEYFPVIVGDGRALIFGSSGPDEHDHTTSNYELFVKALPDGRKIQITDNGKTNRWGRLLKTSR